MSLTVAATVDVFCTGGAVEGGDDRDGVEATGVGVPVAGIHPTVRRTNPIQSHIRNDFVCNMVLSFAYLLRASCWAALLSGSCGEHAPEGTDA